MVVFCSDPSQIGLDIFCLCPKSVPILVKPDIEENWLAVPVCHLSRFALFGWDTIVAPDYLGIKMDEAEADVQLDWYHLDDEVDYYEVWRATDDAYFSPGASGSLKLGEVQPSIMPGHIDYLDAAAVYSEENYYYVVRAINGSGAVNDLQRVGKFNLQVLPNWNLIAWPLLPADLTLDYLLGDQLQGTDDPQTATRVLVWDSTSQTYESAWYCAGICEEWGEPWANHWLTNDYSQSSLTLESDTGFWLQNRSGVMETLVLVGEVAAADRSIQVDQNWQMIGSAFPVSKLLNEANIPATGTNDPQTADRILYWDATTQSYKSAWYCGGSICEGWGEPYFNHWLANDYSQTDIELESGFGIWYQNRHMPFTWINSAPE